MKRLKKNSGPGKLLFTLILCFILSACSKDSNKEPIYQGKWMFESAELAVDTCYAESYIDVNADRSFELYNSCTEELIQGLPEHFSLSGSTLRLTDPETEKVYTIQILGRRDDLLTIRTSLFGTLATVILRKIN
jgi:hypothetical protein